MHGFTHFKSMHFCNKHYSIWLFYLSTCKSMIKKQPTRGNKGTMVHPSQSRHFEKWQLTRRTQRDRMKRRRLKREKLRRVENVVSEAIFGHQWGVQDFWWEECRCFLLPRVLQMNMTGLIQRCEGPDPLSSPFRPASLDTASLVPSRHGVTN